ncbi:kinase-like domain-containing protein [Aspergillus lucknowensis]|uniref:Kinase-like domain-containing protein n=1 Tax=Aspergillus lucknowensis TaxID=176173 RepID=A0ABR4M520_9EURO
MANSPCNRRSSSKQEEFWSHLHAHKADIEELVSFHLRVSRCEVADAADWLFGSYNVCIPVCLNPTSEERVLVRIPLLFKTGEANNPGNVDEKPRCEVATYIWMRQNCPDVPIPRLYWVSFPDETTRSHPLRTGYMIISFMKAGNMLSDTWKMHLLEGKVRRKTLFRDLANIMISLNRTPLPRIGSLTLNNKGGISIVNRPLTLRLQTLENEGIPTIPRDSTYQAIEPYLLDLLQCHDNRIYYQPNAIHDLDDGQQQFAALTMMRGLLPQFISRQYRNGPFYLTLTDLHPSNIFVDDNWHITSLIDLEWACSFLVELQTPPYSLTGQPIDDIEHGEHLQTFDKTINEFIDTFEEQERKAKYLDISHSRTMGTCWNRGSFWYFQAAHSPKGLCRVFNEHIQPRYCEEHCTRKVFDQVSFIQRKVEEEAAYHDRVKECFADGHLYKSSNECS